MPVAMEVIGTPEFNDLEGCPNTFGNIVYYIKSITQLYSRNPYQLYLVTINATLCGGNGIYESLNSGVPISSMATGV